MAGHALVDWIWSLSPPTRRYRALGMDDSGQQAAPAGEPGPPGQSGPPGEPGPLALTERQIDEMVAHCLACYPEEGCGLLTGPPGGHQVRGVYPARNAAASAKLYVVDASDHLRVDRAAELVGDEVIGVYHSHTHTDAYPSPTDVRQAPDPSWHYVLVSLRHEVASVRSYRIDGGTIIEESIELSPRLESD